MGLGRVLIANRGEIAIRIARAAADLHMTSVSVYSHADAMGLHTRVTDARRELPGADAVGAYLDISALIDIALEEGCDCVHPGYGFLAENAAFAEACHEAGLTFVGPSPDTLALFGDKVKARGLAKKAGIPVVPGSDGQLRDAAHATKVAARLGYPVMLKAAAGGGGRGMRRVDTEDGMNEAFDRCGGEARAAFGSSALFLEKIIERPRHIEVQVLGDRDGQVVHLHERDCSVQLRHQKLIEIAPAPNLEDGVRKKLAADAITLARAASFVNAGTVEFLVAPESGQHYFIECNPRIQVEHTVTELVTHTDLVELQFLIASGMSLASLGLANQDAVRPQGFAVQSRVVMQGAGILNAYKEPSGAGIRVDAMGYPGYMPPAQFDPLIAKVICTSNSSASLASAIERASRALGEFHIDGVVTNLPQLRAMLDHPSVRAGDARTTLLAEAPELLAPAPGNRAAAVNLMEQHLPGQPGGTTVPVHQGPSIEVEDDQQGVPCPIQGSLLELSVKEGDSVTAGDTLMVVTAMKMETAVTAPCSGRVTRIADVDVGDSLSAGQVVVAIAPGDGKEQSSAARAANTWQDTLDEVATLRSLAVKRLAPGSDDPGVVRQRDRGKLTCRERIELLLDSGSFREVGSIAGFASYDEDGSIAAFTPANSVGGWGKIEGRFAVVCADDFTSRGGHADGAIAAKSGYLDRLAMEMRAPSIRLLDGSSGGGSVAAMVPEQKKEGESTAKESRGAISAGRPRVLGGGGSFLPGHLGSNMYAEELSTIPVVNMLLGSVVGIGAAKAVLGHFSVMVRDIAQLFVAGPPVVSHAMGYDISKEELGGWQIHCTNGSVDNLAETEEEAAAMTRRFLSYLPQSVYEAPPVMPPDPSDPHDRREEELFTLVPRKRTTTFDIRRAINLLADRNSFFEIGPLWGTDQVTGFCRFNGYPVGVIASDSRHINGGALTADGCDKLRRHLDLCDLFHLPVLNLVDNPGFAVGLEHELTGTIRKGGEWMVAFAQVNIPLFTVVMRRSFGVAGNNYATPRSRPSMRVAWPSADVGGIPPEGGIEAAYKRQLAEAEDPEALRAELNARIESVRGPTGPLNRFQMEEMIDPRDTRRYVCEWLEAAWQIVSQPAALGPRALKFRP